MLIFDADTVMTPSLNISHLRVLLIPHEVFLLRRQGCGYCLEQSSPLVFCYNESSIQVNTEMRLKARMKELIPVHRVF